MKAGSEAHLLYSAKPLGEPIAWAGPLSNTREELPRPCELREGTFIKHK